MIVLAGDLGGTSSRLALVEIDGSGPRILERTIAPSREVPTLPPLVRSFLEGKPRPARACFGVAGPVLGNTVRTSNLPWVVEAPVLAREIGVPATTLINDFAAIGEGWPLLQPGDLETLQEGVAVAGGPIALIGAGTGLGQGCLYHEAGRYRIRDSEGGHATFAARTEQQWKVYRCLEQRFGPVSWERVVSGPGLVAVYQCLAESSIAEEPADISARARLGKDLAAVQALDLFTDAYGAQAGNLALTVLATGGVLVAGGIAPRLISKLRDGTFLRAFRSKGELEPLLTRVPVRVIMTPDVGLLGAAAVAGRGS